MRIRKGEIKINGKKSKEEYRIILGDIVDIPENLLGKQDKSALLSIKDKRLKKLTKEDIQPLILFEDENWVIFNKPAGIVAHEGNNHRKDLSMNDYLETYASDYAQGTFKPSFWYRLDKDTSGVLIWAKNYEALQYLNQIIRDHEIHKTYLTIVTGNPPKHFTIEKALEKSYNDQFNRAQMKINLKSWMQAKTEVETMKTIFHHDLGQISLLKVTLHTGRMHQIRVHLSSEWYPVLWDLIYGNPVINRKLNKIMDIQRQLLHCRNYKFTDHIGKNIDCTAPIPTEFSTFFSPFRE